MGIVGIGEVLEIGKRVFRHKGPILGSHSGSGQLRLLVSVGPLYHLAKVDGMQSAVIGPHVNHPAVFVAIGVDELFVSRISVIQIVAAQLAIRLYLGRGRDYIPKLPDADPGVRVRRSYAGVAADGPLAETGDIITIYVFHDPHGRCIVDRMEIVLQVGPVAGYESGELVIGQLEQRAALVN